jgi:hypothetical protein
LADAFDGAGAFFGAAFLLAFFCTAQHNNDNLWQGHINCCGRGI